MYQTTHSAPEKGIIHTQFQTTLHPKTTLGRQLSKSKGKQHRKSSFLSSSEPKNYMNIIEAANQDLQQYLLNLNEHINKIIHKREASYIGAFQNHAKLVEKQLKKIKAQYNQSKYAEKYVTLQQAISRLQKQCEIFRNQALRYFGILQEKDQELKTVRRQLEIVKKQLQVSDFSKKKFIEVIKTQVTELDLQRFENSKEFEKQFKLSKQRNKTQRSLGVTRDHDRKFRKTLLEFDLKNSSEFYKKSITGRKTARSFLTISSSIRDQIIRSRKKKQSLLIQSNQNSNIEDQNSIQVQTKNNLSNSYIDTRKFEKKELIKQSPDQINDLRLLLKHLLKQKFLQNLNSDSRTKEYIKFNSEQQIDDFLEFLLQNETVCDNVYIENLSHSNQNQKISSSQMSPIQKINIDERYEGNTGDFLNTSIYTVKKLPTKANISANKLQNLNFQDKISKDKIKSNKNLSINCLRAKLNKNKSYKKSRIQENFSLHLKKQKETEIFNL